MAYPSPPQIPQRGARSTFSGAVDAFLRWMAGLPAYLDQFLARLETIAAGGAYAMAFKYVVNDSAIGGPNGNLKIGGGAAQNLATYISVDVVDATNSAVLTRLIDATSSGSAKKAIVRITKKNDPSKWLTFSVAAIASNSGAFPYATLGAQNTGGSSSNPFTEGDDITFTIQPNGDKGDVGNADKKVQTAPAPVNGVVTVDYRNGNCLVWNPAAASTSTLTITNWPSAGTLGEFWIIGTNLGAATVALGGAVNWLRPDGTYASTASINANHGATLRTAGEDNVLLWGRAGSPDRGKVAR